MVGAEVEPSFLALGPFHLALGMNNRCYIFVDKILYYFIIYHKQKLQQFVCVPIININGISIFPFFKSGFIISMGAYMVCPWFLL